jgi:hypothetical protein
VGARRAAGHDVQQRLAVPVLVLRLADLEQHAHLVRGRRRVLGLPSCSGQTGILGAANPNGIPTDYITQFKAMYVSPLINGADPGIPGRAKNPIVTNGWDMVYMPYCTGDVHVGNRVVTYTDPTGQNPPIVFRHVGYNNTIAAMNFLHTRFPSINSCS